jgi:NAD(P)H-nitrite reductase large subunit
MATRHVILGAGPAGQNAIETLRAIDAEADISLVCDEPAYARMVLPYFVEGKVAEVAVKTGDDAWFEQLKVDTHFGQRAASVDTQAAQVVLEDGTSLAYDKLLIATGSRAATPPIPGIDGPGIVNMWTLDDARGYLSTPHSETVIVGAGFIAFTMLDAIVAQSDKLTFVELEPQILPHMLDSAAAGLMKSYLEARGVEIITGTRLEKIEEASGRRRLQLSGGRSLECDCVVVATGVQPNIEFLEGSGIALGPERGDGVLVDRSLQTSAANVYAAGDVAQGADLLTGEQRVHAIQPTAVDHGRVAAASMTGQDANYSGSLVMNILAAQDIEACSFGLWSGDDRESFVVQNEANSIYRKYVWQDDKLVGGILLGPTLAVSNVNDVGMLKGLIQTGVPLGSWKGYLEENPLDLRRAFVASGAARALLDSTLLTGRASPGGGFRLPSLPARRARSPHHAVLVEGAPR